MGVHLLRTFFNCWVQPLRQWVTTLWLYSGPSCPDCPFFEELCDAETNTQIHMVLDHRANLNPEAGPVPLREGVDSTRVSPFGSFFWLFVQFHPLTALVLLLMVLGMLTVHHGGSPCPRTRRRGRQTMPIMRSFGHGNREGRPRVPPERRRWHRGRTPPPNLNPQTRRKDRRGK
jgi:hypothetical protein